nr:MAG: hypothetical protein 3 [Leviviridae sp.]
MKKPTKLLKRVLLDVRLQQLDTIDLDFAEMRSRYEKEGMSFLTITLPTLDDALLKGLARGRLFRSDYVGFRSHKRNGCLPAVMQGFFRRIFHDDGLLLDAPDTCAISAIRQVARLFKKVELPCSDARVKAAYKRYISNDKTADWNKHRCPSDAKLYASVSGYLWSDLESVSGELYCFPGKFGSGATAERSKRNSRHDIRKWPKRSASSFPADYFTVHRPDVPVRVQMVEERDEEPVRVVQVPKTLKTPRTISVEPSYMMLMQQSVAIPLMAYLESERFGFRSIRFVDQSVNRELARRGSTDGSLATIDLSDASDLVSNNLVIETFRKVCPTFLQLIQDSRSSTARMPDKTIVHLQKFASMGSAMCFPVESMIFFTIVMFALVRESGKVPSRHLLQKLARDVAIYGDDIIVKSKMAPVVMETLEDFGLRVNHSKSFHTGLFRESCGGDYYNGVDVTPAYVRQWDDTGTLASPTHKVAYVTLSNIFYLKGMWHVSQYLRDFIDCREKRSGRRVPRSVHPIGCLHYVSFLYSTNLVWAPKTQSFRVRGLHPKSVNEVDSVESDSGIFHRMLGDVLLRDSLADLRDKFRTPHARSWNPVIASQYGKHDRKPDELLDVPETESDNPSRVFALCSGVQDPRSHSAGSPDRFTSYQETDWRDLGTRRPLEHLTVAVGCGSLDLSERPYSLCLKSRWTASPAGPIWNRKISK